MREIEALQKEVWGSDDRDIVPLTIFAATREVGAILIGAFDGASLIGFAYSFVGREDGRMVHHSHMLAVRPIYRNFNLGQTQVSAAGSSSRARHHPDDVDI